MKSLVEAEAGEQKQLIGEKTKMSEAAGGATAGSEGF